MSRVIVYHRYYGCDTGCCGHATMFVPDDATDDQIEDLVWSGDDHFEFGCDWENRGIEFARDLVRRTFGEEHVADLDWEHCIIEED